ncbi:MAG: ATP-binding cassette domain-containing protein [Clostridiaceae bacterium]|nr:ATP-binding cassette domain-containing protein [Clostridiaceae bacterium]
MIEAYGVSLQYRDGTMALKNVQLKVDRGEFVYITGPSGSGKTSLLKLMMGIEYPTSGTLSVLGRPISRRNTGKIRKMRREIGPVFQEFKLIQGRTAMENIIMGMRFLKIPYREMKQEASNALAVVGLEHKAYTRVENLSWGEAQRVAIARAIARKPALILADEPTGNLDMDNAVNILSLLESIKDKDTTVIVTTHATHLIENQRNVTLIHIEKGNITIERRGKE